MTRPDPTGRAWPAGTGYRTSVLVGVVVLVARAVLGVPAEAQSAPSGAVRYQPPLVAPITDPFRPPAQPWLPGNRGLEYQTPPGTLVGAIGPGLVVFAGPVAGQLYVTVLHPDGIRSSYSYLAAVHVAVGDRVHVGQAVGISGVVFHLGARVGETYIDPASLFGTVVGSASTFLVPRGSPGAGPGAATHPGARPSRPDDPRAGGGIAARAAVGDALTRPLHAMVDDLVAGVHRSIGSASLGG